MALATRKQIPDLIADNKPFKGSSIYAEKVTNAAQIGPVKMPQEEYRLMLSRKPVYVVYSYWTPIAYVGSNGAAYIPDVKYSTTTSNHQRLAREGFAK